MSEPLTNRQQSYVSRIIQGSLLRQLGTYGFAYFLLLWHAMFFLNFLGFPTSLGEDEAFVPIWALYWRFCQAHVHLALCAVAIFPLFYWNALRLTHRIAGPLERFRQALEKLQQGEKVKPVTLRRDDLLVEYQQAFNRYLAFLEEKNRSKTRPEPETAAEPGTCPLLRELATMQSEIQQATREKL